MNSLSTASWWRALPIAGLVLLLASAGAIACSDDDDDNTQEPGGVPTGGTTDDSDATGTRTGSAGTRTATAGGNGTNTPGANATGTISPGGGSQSGDRRTGMAEVDAIIDAVEERGTATLADRAAFLELQCVAQPLGAGGPPQCRSGESDGTAVQVFPVVGCEGEYIREDDLEEYFEQRFAGSDPVLYAVVQHTAPPQSEQFPTGDYGAIFETAGQNGAMVGINETGDVVTFVTQCQASAEEILGAQDGEVLVEPGQ